MNTQIEKLPAKTYKLVVTIEQSEINKAFEQAVNNLTSNIAVPGFRKGQAPSGITEEKIDESRLNGEVANIIIPKAVSQAIKEHHLNPILSPKVNLKQLEKNKDCIIEVTIIEHPEVVLGDYKSLIKLSSNTPNNTNHPNDPKNTSNVTNTLLKTTTIEISQTLVEGEVSQMFVNLIEQTKKLNITLDDYLRSINKTLDNLKEDFKTQAENNIKLEFILSEIAKVENITVSELEIEQAINSTPSAKDKEELRKEENKWYIKSVLLKNKVLSWLSSLINETHKSNESH